jgi:hypothetical protein
LDDGATFSSGGYWNWFLVNYSSYTIAFRETGGQSEKSEMNIERKSKMSVEVEQALLSEIVELNGEFWADETRTESHLTLIQKFGSKGQAVEQTFTLLWNGLMIACQSLPENSGQSVKSE